MGTFFKEVFKDKTKTPNIMERFETVEIGRRFDGTKIVRNQFINDDNTNYLIKAQSYFTKEEKKTAKLNYKLTA